MPQVRFNIMGMKFGGELKNFTGMTLNLTRIILFWQVHIPIINMSLQILSTIESLLRGCHSSAQIFHSLFQK